MPPARRFTQHRVVVAGMGGIGGTALTIQLVSGQFTEIFDPTLEDSYRKLTSVDEEEVMLDLQRSRPTENSALLEYSIRLGEGFTLVYSITDQNSFAEIKQLYHEILRVKERDYFPLVLIGTKLDLEGSDRTVSTAEGMNLAKQFGCPFFETSAKLGTNVNEAFAELVREIRRYNRTQHVGPRGGDGEGAYNPNDQGDTKRGCCGGCVII